MLPLFAKSRKAAIIKEQQQEKNYEKQYSAVIPACIKTSRHFPRPPYTHFDTIYYSALCK
jgi:hypothetical protein